MKKLPPVGNDYQMLQKKEKFTNYPKRITMKIYEKPQIQIIDLYLEQTILQASGVYSMGLTDEDVDDCDN